MEWQETAAIQDRKQSVAVADHDGGDLLLRLAAPLDNKGSGIVSPNSRGCTVLVLIINDSITLLHIHPKGQEFSDFMQLPIGHQKFLRWLCRH